MIIHLIIDTSSDEVGVSIPKEFSRNLKVLKIIEENLVHDLKYKLVKIDAKLRKVITNAKKDSNARRSVE